MLVNLPNLALTPRFQAKSAEERENAQDCSYYFNEQLAAACMKLAQDYPHCVIDNFDINSIFEHVYHNPERFFFERAKLKTAYKDSPDFNDPSDGLSPAQGYMFYDDIHPSADVHALLAAYFYDRLALKYQLLEPNKPCARNKLIPEDALIGCFRKHYKERREQDKKSILNFLHSSKFDYHNAD